MTRKQELESQIRALRLELNEIIDAEDAQRNATYVGRCFKTRNNYSMPEKEADYWWLYVKVTGLDDGCIVGVKSEVRVDGTVMLERASSLMSRTLDSYTPISADEYATAMDKTLSVVLSIARM